MNSYTACVFGLLEIGFMTTDLLPILTTSYMLPKTEGLYRRSCVWQLSAESHQCESRESLRVRVVPKPEKSLLTSSEIINLNMVANASSDLVYGDNVSLEQMESVLNHSYTFVKVYGLQLLKSKTANTGEDMRWPDVLRRMSAPTSRQYVHLGKVTLKLTRPLDKMEENNEVFPSSPVSEGTAQVDLVFIELTRKKNCFSSVLLERSSTANMLSCMLGLSISLLFGYSTKYERCVAAMKASWWEPEPVSRNRTASNKEFAYLHSLHGFQHIPFIRT